RRADFRDALASTRTQAHPLRPSSARKARIGDVDRGPRRRRNRSDYRASIDTLRTSGNMHCRSAGTTQFALKYLALAADSVSGVRCAARCAPIGFAISSSFMARLVAREKYLLDGAQKFFIR